MTNLVPYNEQIPNFHGSYASGAVGKTTQTKVNIEQTKIEQDYMIIKLTKNINKELTEGTVKEFPKVVAEQLIKEGKAVLIKSSSSNIVKK